MTCTPPASSCPRVQAPGKDHKYLVGTEDGAIVECSKVCARTTGAVRLTEGQPGPGQGRQEPALGASSHHFSCGAIWRFWPQATRRLMQARPQPLVPAWPCLAQAYSSEYLASFAAHSMAVYAVRWNRLHPSIFLSASVDWTLRVWDERTPRAGPPLTFDLGDAVGDAAWAPFSSTVMAAVTDDGRVHVFDLAANRLAPLCVQKVRAGEGAGGRSGARAGGRRQPTDMAAARV